MSLFTLKKMIFCNNCKKKINNYFQNAQGSCMTHKKMRRKKLENAQQLCALYSAHTSGSSRTGEAAGQRGERWGHRGHRGHRGHVGLLAHHPEDGGSDRHEREDWKWRLKVFFFKYQYITSRRFPHDFFLILKLHFARPTPFPTFIAIFSFFFLGLVSSRLVSSLTFPSCGTLCLNLRL